MTLDDAGLCEVFFVGMSYSIFGGFDAEEYVAGLCGEFGEVDIEGFGLFGELGVDVD